MAATIADVLEAARAKIESSTGASVGLGKPVRSESGLLMLPYKLYESPEHRNPPSLRPGTGPESLRLNMVVSCLLAPNSPSGYAALGEGLMSVFDTPFIEVGASRVAVSSTSLSTDELATIFSAAGIPLTLAVTFQLKWKLDRAAGSS